MKRSLLLRKPDFVKFWVGEGVSQFGTQVTVLALPLTAILVLNAGPFQVGVIRFLELIPYLAFALLFGVWVDRLRRRPIMIVANVARLIMIGLVPILASLDQLNLPILMVLTFGVGSFSVLFDVTWMSYVPTLVQDRELLVQANSMLGATSSAAETAGPGIGGALVGVFTAPIAMAVDAASYLVSLISLLLIRLPEPTPSPAQARRSIRAELAEGLRWVFRNRYLRVIAAVGAASNFFTTAIVAMFVLYAVRDAGLKPGTLGLVLSIGAAGGLIGALMSGRVVRRLTVGRTYVVGLSVTFLSPLIIPAASGSEIVLSAMFAGAFFLMYFGMGMTNVVVLTLRQIVTPERMLGRMNAAMRMLMFGLAALGGPFGGLIGSLTSLRIALWVSAIGAALILVPLILSPVARLRQMPPPAVDPATAMGVSSESSEQVG